MVEVRVLGPTTVCTNGVDRPIRSAGQLVIIAHLSLAEGHRVEQDVLVDEIWDVLPANPVHALQAHVSRLRHTTALPVVHTGSGYHLDPELVRVDATAFEALLERALGASPAAAAELLEEALGLWRGPALQGVPDTPSTNAHRTHLEMRRQRASEALVDALLASGRADDALPLLVESVEHDPLDEQRWGQLMTALALTGRRGAALETYARARRQLVDGLGLEPSAQLQKTHRQILLDTPPPTSLPVPTGLVGRDREWDALTSSWGEAESGQRVAVVSGEPGIGKTFLASHFVRALPDPSVHFARADRALGTPHGVLAQLVRSEHDPDGPSLTGRLGAAATALHAVVPELVPEPTTAGTSDPQVERYRIVLGLRRWLRDATEHGPLCLVVDDLQWADPDSLRLLAEVWSQPHPAPVLWLVTLRDDEHPPDSPVAALLQHAVRPSDCVTSVPLRGVDREAVGQLLTSGVSPQSLSKDTLDEVAESTAGNPLLVTALARHLHDSGDPGRSAALPRELRTIVDAYVLRLDPRQRDLLNVAAVIGEEFDAALISLTGAADAEEVDEFLTAAQHFGLLVGDSGGPQQRFRHALVHSAVVAQIPPLRRARLHLMVAQAVEKASSVPDRLHVLAHHHLRALSLIGPDEVLPHVLAAAESSLRQGAPTVAYELYREAHALLTDTTPQLLRLDVLLGLGGAGFRAGADHRDHLLEAARLANQMGEMEQLVRAAVTNHRGWYSSITDVDLDRIAVIEAALEALPAGPSYAPDRSRLLSLWAMENVRDSARRDEVRARSAESIRIAEEIADAGLLGEIMCHRFSVLFATFSDPAGTLAFAQRLDALARRRLDPELELNSAIAVAQAAMMMGEFATADPALDRSEQLANALSHPPRMWLVGTWRATRTAMGGDLALAETQATEACTMGTSFEQPDAQTWFMGQLFAFHHVSGHLAELVDLVEAEVKTLDGQIPAWSAALALTLAHVGRHTETAEIVDGFCRTGFTTLPLDVLRLHGLCYLADAVTTAQYADAAPALYDVLLPHAGLIANNATLDAGPVDLRLAGLAALVGDSAAARSHLDDAEDFCRTHDARLWLEHVLALRTDLG